MFSRALGYAKAAFHDWLDDDALRLGASLAYFTLFSLAPLLLVVVSLADWLLGPESEQVVLAQLRALAGDRAGAALDEVAKGVLAQRSVGGALFGIAVALIGASGVFQELQTSMNAIWEVEPQKTSGWKAWVKERGVAFLMVIGSGLLLVVSFGVTAALGTAGEFFSQRLPGGETLLHVWNALLSTAVLTLVFGVLFKIVPNVKIEWRDVWLGALVTAVLFTIGKTLIGLYLGTSGVTSVFGAASSVAVLLIFVYYSSLIFFFGAELTQVHANTRH